MREKNKIKYKQTKAAPESWGKYISKKNIKQKQRTLPDFQKDWNNTK